MIEYQEGSLRDDFAFGPLLLVRVSAWREALLSLKTEYEFAGLYALRLALSRIAPIVHIDEYLYSVKEIDTRASGEKIFDYVNPRNRQVQIEMEKACTEHLKIIEAYLSPVFKEIDWSKDSASFAVEASVIIPVRNRVRTIRNAIKSVLAQKTNFNFNLIVIDNHSTDGTTEAIGEFASDSRLVHIIPENARIWESVVVGTQVFIILHAESLLSSWIVMMFIALRILCRKWLILSMSNNVRWL